MIPKSGFALVTPGFIEGLSAGAEKPFEDIEFWTVHGGTAVTYIEMSLRVTLSQKLIEQMAAVQEYAMIVNALNQGVPDAIGQFLSFRSSVASAQTPLSMRERRRIVATLTERTFAILS